MNPHPGEVWLADLGLAAKTRPVIVVSRFDPDPPRALVIYVPLTSQNRGSKYEVDMPRLPFLRLDGVANVQGVASISVTRLERKPGQIPNDVLERIRQALAFALKMACALPNELGLTRALLIFFKVKSNRFPDEAERLVSGFRDGDATWKVGDVGPIAGGAFLDDDLVAHESVFQSGLPENTIQSATRNVNGRVAGNREDTRLCRVLVMSTAAARPPEIPAVGYNDVYGLANFHSSVGHCC